MFRRARHLFAGVLLMALLLSGPHAVLPQARVRERRANRHAGAEARRDRLAARRRDQRRVG